MPFRAASSAAADASADTSADASADTRADAPADANAPGLTTASATATKSPAHAMPTSWRAKYQRGVFAIDLAAAAIGVVVANALRFDGNTALARPSYLLFAIALPLVWVFCTALNRAYEVRFLGAGTIEFERIGRAFLQLTAVVTFVAYATKADLSRGLVILALPATLLLSVSGRYAVRKAVHRRRRSGRAVVPVLAVGSIDEIVQFNDTLQANGHVGLRIAAACISPDGSGDISALTDRGIARVGDVDSIRDAVVESGAHSIAVVSRNLSGEKLRWISWQLEGTDTDLVVIPGLTEVAGRRLDIQQVGGLPLVYVAQPEFRGIHRVLKSGFDRTVAALVLLMVAPLMLAIAAAVRLTSRGPALFFQTRVGKDGKTFRMVKFRSMCQGAEHKLVELRESNEFEGGTLFKIREDPRITRVGKVLRRLSMDELPQLFNVLGGSMSLVGPRPPLPAEVATYAGAAQRRLLVKPGITGLWQISGRSDLSWEESVRLDLRYVEGWSLALDMIVLAKTVSAVVRARGAY